MFKGKFVKVSIACERRNVLFVKLFVVFSNYSYSFNNKNNFECRQCLKKFAENALFCGISFPGIYDPIVSINYVFGIRHVKPTPEKEK
jgi:hypothetical protein